MDINDKLDQLEKDVIICRESVGSRITSLEIKSDLLSKLLENFITKHQFEPVKLIAYGLAGGILITVLTAVMAKALGI